MERVWVKCALAARCLGHGAGFGRVGRGGNTANAIDGYEPVRIPRDGGGAMQFSQLEFTGTLVATDPAVFLAAVRAGFGRAKAFGCGLMLIRRA